jgi:hypothetical protein
MHRHEADDYRHDAKQAEQHRPQHRALRARG